MTAIFSKISGRNLPKDFVVTPMGARHRSNVHLIEERHTLDGAGGRLRKYDPNGRTVEDFGPVPQERGVKTHSLHRVASTTPIVPAPATGFIVSAECHSASGMPIVSFRTSWVVPSAPLSRSGQIIFIWNGMMPVDEWVLQPVLQWGDNDISGGEYWQLVSFYAHSETQAFHSNSVRVNEGDIVTGVISQTGSNGDQFSYTSEFEGIPQTQLAATNVNQLVECWLALEAYVTQASDYPTREIKMREIDVRTSNGSEAVNWVADNHWLIGPSGPKDYGQQALVRVNGPQAEVDLFCYDLKELAVISNSDGRLELFYTSRNDALYHRSQIPPINAWGDDEPLGLGNFAKQLAPVLMRNGHLELFYVGTNDKIYRQQQTDEGWSDEAAFGGTAKQIAAAQNADGRVEIFYIGTDDKIYHVWETVEGGTSGQQPLGGSAKRIAIATNEDGRLELFYVGTNNELYHNWQVAPNGGWSGEASLGGQATQLAVGQNANGSLEVFYVTIDGQLYHNWQTAPNNGWNGGDNFGQISARQIATGKDSNGHQQLFFIGTDGQIYQMSQVIINGGWGPATAFAGPASNIALGQNADGRLEIFYLCPTSAALFQSAKSPLFQKWQIASGKPDWSAATQI